VAARLPKTGEEERNFFVVEGLANALLEFVHGVHVHAVAKFYRKREELPSLAILLEGDFYTWQRAHPMFNGYDVAGSFIRFLLDSYGVEKVKTYYTGTPAREAFGIEGEEMESGWHAALDTYDLRPEVETLLAMRHGEDVGFTEVEADPEKRIPPEILGEEKDWTSLLEEALQPDGGEWKREEDAIVGTDELGDPWAICDLGSKKYESCIVRARILTEGVQGGVMLRLGAGCNAMVVGNGTFIYRNGRPSAMTPRRRINSDGALDLMLIRRGGHGEIWVDGIRMIEGEVDSIAAPVGIGIHSGMARFERLRVREIE
jgi:hypothetical protein